MRPYQAADGVRRNRIWKTTAHAGTPQVRRYQPAIALETLVALAFTREEYAGRFAFDTMERALVTAASIVAHLVEQRQPVGLCTSGYNAAARPAAPSLPVGHGHAHLMAIMGALGQLSHATRRPARAAEHCGCAPGLGQHRGGNHRQRGPELVARLLPLLRRGLSVALIVAKTERPPTWACRASMALPATASGATAGLRRGE